MKTVSSGCVLLVFLHAAAAGGEIRLKNRTLRAAADVRRAYGAAGTRSAGRIHALADFGRVPTARDVRELERRGIRVTGAAPDTALVISAPAGVGLEIPGLEWVSTFEASDKLSPRLALEQRAFVVEFHADVPGEAARALAEEAGFHPLSHPALLRNQLLVAGDSGALAGLAEWDEVAYVFPASLDLISGAPLAACPGALTEAGVIGQYVGVGGGWRGAGAGELEIGYHFGNLTSRIAPSTVKAEIARALQEWARHARVRFREADTASAPRTIDILFGSRAHGDAYPFDGPGRVLAHTFYPAPPNAEPIAGDMHLDNDEDWQLASGIDLFTVALHEAGHALGLGHSDRPGSVMYPYYRLGAQLADDDIAGVRALYGSREESKVDPPPAEPPKAAPTLALEVTNPAAAVFETTAAWIALSGKAGGGTGAIRVQWRSDRGQSGTATGSASWSIASAPLADGVNTIVVSAADAGGVVVSKTITVTRKAQAIAPEDDTTPPALRITSPAFTIASTSAAFLVVKGTASDSGGVAAVRWSNSVGGSGDAYGTENWSATASLQPGTNTITIRAVDAAGNSSWRSLMVVRR